MNKKQNAGAPKIYTDEQMRELALDVKHKLKGQKLTFSLLESHTGIGRNTWSRRFKKIVEQLNTPVLRSLEITEEDNVYFPNIEEMIERCKGNIDKIKQELVEYEQLFYEIYSKMKNLEIQNRTFKDQGNVIEKLQVQVNQLKKDKFHFEELYKQTIAASAIPSLKESQGLKENVLSFEKNIDKNSKLTNLKGFFPENDSPDKINTTFENTESAKKLSLLFPNIMKKD
jgi:hypothetical protein